MAKLDQTELDQTVMVNGQPMAVSLAGAFLLSLRPDERRKAVNLADARQLVGLSIVDGVGGSLQFVGTLAEMENRLFGYRNRRLPNASSVI